MMRNEVDGNLLTRLIIYRSRWRRVFKKARSSLYKMNWFKTGHDLEGRSLKFSMKSINNLQYVGKILIKEV